MPGHQRNNCRIEAVLHSGFHVLAKIATVTAAGLFQGPGWSDPVWRKMKSLVAPALALMLLGGTIPARAEGLLRYAQAGTNARTVESLNMAAVPDLDRGEIRRVQTALREKGFDPGAINGVINPRTKSAVEKFQDRFGIKATGDLNNQTLFALGVVGNLGEGKGNESAQPKEAEQPSKPRRAKTPPKEKSVQRNSERATGSRTRWCAAYHNGSQNCGFYTLDQCRASVSGVGGTCVPN